MSVVMFWMLLSSQAGGSDVERTKKKRRGDRYSVQTSLIVAALKKMLPIGLNMCSPADQELINLAKTRYSLVVWSPYICLSIYLISLDVLRKFHFRLVSKKVNWAGCVVDP